MLNVCECVQHVEAADADSPYVIPIDSESFEVVRPSICLVFLFSTYRWQFSRCFDESQFTAMPRTKGTNVIENYSDRIFLRLFCNATSDFESSLYE